MKRLLNLTNIFLSFIYLNFDFRIKKYQEEKNKGITKTNIMIIENNIKAPIHALNDNKAS